MDKAELIDKYRDINTVHDWWECTESDLKDKLADLGFELDKMYFSGFWSQGDGACFTGTMRDWKKFVDNEPTFSRDCPGTALFLANGEDGAFDIYHRGNYCHAYSVSCDFDSDVESWLEINEIADEALAEDTDLERRMLYALYEPAKHEDADKWLTEYFRDMMRDLYDNLEKEHDYLTSDEAVWETIEANELDEELDDDISELDACAAEQLPDT